MNRSITFVFVLVFITAPCIIIIQPVKALEDSWTTKEPMPTPRTSLGVAVLNDKIYAIGGYPDLNVTEEYDPATDTWTTKTAMPTPRFNFAIAVCQNKIYCMGGLIADRNSYGSSLTGAIEVYDPATDTWEAKNPMPTPRTQLEANVVDGKIYLTGGRTGGQNSTVTLNEIYDPISETWTTKSHMPYPATLYASAVVDNRIYYLGGQNEFNSPANLDLNQIYDSVTDSWTLGAALPNAVSDAAACTASNSDASRIYLIGGHPITGGSSTNTVQIYNPKLDSWSTGVSMPSARFGLALGYVNDTIFAIGGTDDYILPGEPASAKNEAYTPTNEFPSLSPTLSSPSPTLTTIASPSATTLPPTPSPSIPELTTWIILPSLALGAVAWTVASRRKHRV